MIDRIRQRLDPGTKRQIANARLRLRRPLAPVRALPDFMIIGAQRAGTSSLYRYLAAHPQIVPSVRKETEYFSREYRLGEDWYRAHYPLRLRPGLTFEATPDYLCFPGAAERASALVPAARIVVILRDPVERAWSHYNHMVRLGFEELSFDDALETESSRIADDLAAIGDSGRRPNEFLRFNYTYRGHYAEQIRAWIDAFGRDQTHVVTFEELMEKPAAVLPALTDFLGVEPRGTAGWGNRSYRSGTPQGGHNAMSASARVRLEEEFAPANERLRALLDWTQLPSAW